LIVSALNLETQAAEIDPTAPLYGEGMGLDSIDILEVALTVSKTYGVKLRSDDDLNRKIFNSLRSLNEHIQQHRLNRAAASSRRCVMADIPLIRNFDAGAVFAFRDRRPLRVEEFLGRSPLAGRSDSGSAIRSEYVLGPLSICRRPRRSAVAPPGQLVAAQ